MWNLEVLIISATLYCAAKAWNINRVRLLHFVFVSIELTTYFYHHISKSHKSMESKKVIICKQTLISRILTEKNDH